MLGLSDFRRDTTCMSRGLWSLLAWEIGQNWRVQSVVWSTWRKGKGSGPSFSLPRCLWRVWPPAQSMPHSWGMDPRFRGVTCPGGLFWADPASAGSSHWLQKGSSYQSQLSSLDLGAGMRVLGVPFYSCSPWNLCPRCLPPHPGPPLCCLRRCHLRDGGTVPLASLPGYRAHFGMGLIQSNILEYHMQKLIDDNWVQPRIPATQPYQSLIFATSFRYT